MTTVTRYVGTYVNKDDMRTLMTACQGQHTHATEAEAQAWIDAVIANNNASTVKQIWGDNPRFEVRPVDCWKMPDGTHGDPKGVWFA